MYILCADPENPVRGGDRGCPETFLVSTEDRTDHPREENWTSISKETYSNLCFSGASGPSVPHALDPPMYTLLQRFDA